MAHQLRSCKTALLKLGQGKVPTCSCHVRSQNCNANIESEVGSAWLPHTFGQAPLSSRMSAILMLTEKALPASLRPPQGQIKISGVKRSRSLNTEQVCKALIEYPFEGYKMTSLYSIANEHNGLPSHQSLSNDVNDSRATGPLCDLLHELKLVRSVIQPFSYTTDDIIIREDCSPVNDMDFRESSYIQRKGSLDSNDTGIISRFKESVTVLPTNPPHTVLSNTSFPSSTPSISHMTLCSTPNIKPVASVNMTNSSAPLDHVTGQHCVSMSDSKDKIDKGASPVQSTTKRKPGEKPTEETLLLMKEHLSESIPRIFRGTHDYRIYINDLIFENNFWGPSVTSKGLQPYALYLGKLRLAAHFKYAQTKVELLKITTHESDGTVRARWRIQALPQMKIFTNFWKFFPGRFRKVVTQESEIYEGISTFYVQGDGMVYKHRVDRVIEDEELDTNKSGIALKMAVLIGLVPRPSIEELAALLYGDNDFGIFPN